MPDIRITPTLDDFKRVTLPEFPLSHGGDFAQTDTIQFAPMQVKVGTGIQGIATHPNSTQWPPSGRRFASSYWVHPFSTINGDVEVWGEPIGGNASGIAWSLGLFQDPGGANTIDGYFFRQEVTSGGGATRLYKYTNGSRVVIGGGSSGFTGAFPNYGLLMRITPAGAITCYISKNATSLWTLKISVTDTTYTGTFYLALGVTDNSSATLPGWYKFGGGQPVQARSQIYRILNGLRPLPV